MSRAWHQRFEAQLQGGPPCELVAAGPHVVPAVLALPLDRRGDGQVGGRVPRALPLVAREEARIVTLVAPAEDERVHVTLQLPPNVEEAGALGCAHPFVAVAGVEVGIELADVQRQVPGDMRAVDDGRDASFTRPLA